MSTLSLRKIKHDGSSIDNIALNSDGTTTMGSELNVTSLKGVSGNKLQLRSGDSSFGVSLQNISGVDLLAVDAVGRVRMPYQPAFKAHTSGFAKSASWQQITGLSTVVFNTGLHYNPSNSRFTAPVNGQYIFTVGGWSSANSAGSRYATSFSINGGGQGFLSGGSYCATDSPMNTHSEAFYLSANDTVDLFGFSAISTTWGGGHVFWWSGYLLN
jgi:hypothetical protein